MPEHKCSYKGCNRDVYRSGEKCIFHAEEKDPQDFIEFMNTELDIYERKQESWDFSGWTFPIRLSFSNRVFRSEINFSNATFKYISCFEKTVFEDGAIFEEATFEKGADFTGALFNGCKFENSRFIKRANFQDVIFNDWAEFAGVECREEMDFEGATFANLSDFRESDLHGTLNLRYVSFAKLGNFVDAIIRGRVRIDWPGEGLGQEKAGKEAKRGQLLLQNLKFEKQEDGEEPLLDLRVNALQEDSKLLIHDTKMDYVLLEGTDCRQIEFKNVTWREHKEKWHAKRRIVADEHFIRTDQSVFGKDMPCWNRIAIIYQQLVYRYRKDLHHQLTNDFERGIFEARLMAAKEKGDWKNEWLLRFYKEASDFSGSIMRPAVWTLLLTIICGLFYGHLLYSGHWVWPWQTELPLVFKSGAAALRIVTLDRGLIIREIGATAGNESKLFWVSLVAAFQIIVTAILITLLIFSVRRRFKHTE